MPSERGEVPSNGRRAIAMYFAIAYLIPFVGDLAFGGDLDTGFLRRPVTVYGIVLMAGTFALFLYFSRHSTRVLAPGRVSPFAGAIASAIRVYDRLRLGVAVAALGVSQFILAAGLNNYRYGDVGISESGSPLILISISINTIIVVDLFRLLFLEDPQVPVSLRRRAENVLICGAYLIGAASAFAVLFGLSAMLRSLFPRQFGRLLFAPVKLSLWRRARRAIIGGTIGIVFFLFAWLSNEGIKASTGGEKTPLLGAIERTDEVLAQADWVLAYFRYLVARSCVYYYSTLYLADNPIGITEVAGTAPIAVPLKNLAFRADYILGGPFGVKRPDVVSIMRLNYLMITTLTPNLRTGSAPGVVGAFTYSLPPPFNILLCAVYLAFVARVIDVLLWRWRGRVLSGVGLVLIFIQLEDVLQSPFDLLSLVDAGAIHVFLLLALYQLERARWAQAVSGIAPGGLAPERALRPPPSVTAAST